MSQTFELSLIWTAGEWSQTELLSRCALLIYLAAVVIISFVQRRQVFLTTNESLISSWSCLSIDTLSFYSTMQSLDLLTLHFFRGGISKARCFKHGQRCFLMITEETTRMVFMLRNVYRIVYLYSESWIFFWRGGGNLRHWNVNMKSSLFCLDTIMGSEWQWLPLSDSL